MKGSYRIGKPYGEGCSEALRTALHIAECYGFSINNYDNYVGTVDMNDKEAQLDILRTSGRCSGRRRLDGYRSLLSR